MGTGAVRLTLALGTLEKQLRDTARRVKVCDGCLTAAYDEGAGDHGLQVTICTDMGADIADHLCDAREEPGTGPCACACNS